MIHSPAKAFRHLLRKIARQTVLIAVVLALSGAPSHVTQGVAWWRMVESSGGFTEAMFEAAPCGLCGAARKLSRDSDDDPESPAPIERLPGLRLLATEANPLSVPAVLPGSVERTKLSLRPVIPPGSRLDRPPTPPPRVRV